MLPKIILSPDHLDQITRHIEHCLPEEACGLIGGMECQARQVIPVENDLHSPVRFRMAPLAQLQAFDQIEAHRLDLLAIYHSHPRGPAGPSASDIAEFFYPGAAVMIVSPLDLDNTIKRMSEGLVWGNWKINGFFIDHNAVHTVKLSLLEERNE